MNWYACAAGFVAGLAKKQPGRIETMARKKKDKPWHLKVTWTLSIVMLLLIAGFFYQSFQEMLEIEPVQVAIERITE
jgi:hypothetical protein